MSRLTFDEANAQITEAMTGRTVEYVERVGKELHFCMTDGHVVVVQATVDGHIVRKRVDVRIVVPAVEVHSAAGDPHQGTIYGNLIRMGLVKFTTERAN